MTDHKLTGDELDATLRRAAAGDSSARNLIFQQHRARLKRMISLRMDGRLAPRIDPSDIVQETLIEAAKQLSDYVQKPPLPFYPWLRRIAWRRLTDQFRRHLAAQKRSVNREQRWSPPLSGDSVVALAGLITSPDSGPSTRLIKQEARKSLENALDQIRDVDREILVMWYLEQMSVVEIAATLEMTEAGVKSRHRRALVRLGKALQNADG